MLPKNPTSVMTRKEVEEFLTEATNKAVDEIKKEHEQKKQEPLITEKEAAEFLTSVLKEWDKGHEQKKQETTSLKAVTLDERMGQAGDQQGN